MLWLFFGRLNSFSLIGLKMHNRLIKIIILSCLPFHMNMHVYNCIQKGIWMHCNKNV